MTTQRTFSERHSAPLQFPQSDLVAYCWWYDGSLEENTKE